MQTDDLNLSRFSQHSLYDGALPQPVHSGGAPNLAGIARPDSTMLSDLLAKNTTAQQQAATAFAEAAAERNNYTVDQLRQAATQQVQIDVSAEMASRLALSDGADKAFYNADGSFREDSYKRYRADIIKRLSGLDKGYIGDEAQARASAAQHEVQSRILGQMDTQLAAQMAPRAKAATERNSKLLAAQGRHAEAAAVIAGCDYYTPAEKQLAAHELHQDAAIWNAQVAVNNGDTAGYLSYISDPEVWNSLTPDTQRRLLSMQGAAQSRGGAVVETVDRETGQRGVRREPRELPCGTPRYITELYAVNNGDLTAGDAKQAFSDLLPQLVSDMVSDPDSEEQAQRVLNIVSIADSSQADYARRLIKNRREYLTGQGSFDFQSTWRHMPKDLLFSDAYLRQLQSWSNASHEYDENGNRTPNAKIAASKAKARREAMQQTIDNLEGSAWSMYQRWLDTQPQKPSNREMADAYTNIIEELLRKAKIERNIRDNAFFSNLNSDAAERRQRAAAEHSESFAAEVQAEDNRRLEARRLADEAQQAEQREAMFGNDVDVYWNCDTNRFNTARLPDSASANIVYVPKGSPMAGQAIQVCCGRVAVDCEIREADISGTALSTRAAWALGIVAGQDHSQIRIDDRGVAHISRASDIPQVRMGRFIYDSEARLDRNGNMQAHQSDEGLEYAGLNQKYDPQEVAHLDSLIRSGRHAEAKQYAIRCYITKTQSVADSMAAIGLRSAPLEYSMRDIYFNMGEGGLAAVVAKATGAARNTPPYQAVATYLSNHSHADLLRALYDARARHYEAIIEANPAMQKNRAGWMNRNRDVLNNALELLTP